MKTIRVWCLLVVMLIAAPALSLAADVADTVFVNGKVLTVDDRFSVAQAVAVKGERVMATGSNAEIGKLAGPQTRRIDLKGKTVIPGLIDNHAHFMRAAEYWDREVRLDGVTSRKQALEMIAAKARASKPGEWVLVLGGWSIEQFADDRRGFSKEELDRIAPNNPLVLQLIYFRIYTNTPGLKALGIDDKTPNPPGGTIVRDSKGQATGVLNGGGAVRVTLAKLGEVPMPKMIENAKAMYAELNRMGMTSYIG